MQHWLVLELFKPRVLTSILFSSPSCKLVFLLETSFFLFIFFKKLRIILLKMDYLCNPLNPISKPYVSSFHRIILFGFIEWQSKWDGKYHLICYVWTIFYSHCYVILEFVRYVFLSFALKYMKYSFGIFLKFLKT